MIVFRTVSGEDIDLGNFDPSCLNIADIACGLSKVCRFGGQLRKFYSVAQHSVLVSSLVDEPYKLAALLHDAAEAYIGDMTHNLKHSGGLTFYRAVEHDIEEAVAQFFRLNTSDVCRYQVKAADNLAAIFERVILQEVKPFTSEDIARLIANGFIGTNQHAHLAAVALRDRLPMVESFFPMSPGVAEATFLDTFFNLDRITLR